MPWEIRLTDAMDGLRSLEDASVDFILTDPAYASLNKWREMGTTTRLTNSTMSSNEWFPTVPNEFFVDFFVECFRVLRNKTYICVLCDEETADIMKPMMDAAKFRRYKSLIWHKVGKLEKVNCQNCGHHVTDRHRKGQPGMGYPFRSSYEMILLAQKGKRPPPENRSVRNFIDDIEEVPWIKTPKAYPTQKPVELCERLIRQATAEGDLVLDPFAGSGSCGEAAFNLQRNFLGFDVEQKALDYFERRKQHWVYNTPEEAPLMTGGVFDMFGNGDK